MTNLDALVTKDLAAAAAANRDRLGTLDDTLRAVAPAASVAVARTSTLTDLRLLALSDVFASRVARIASGATALACIALSVAGMLLVSSEAGPRVLVDLFVGTPVDLGTRYVIACLVVHVVAGEIARGAFARIVAEDATIAGSLVARVDRWAVAISIAGPFVLAMSLGVAFVTLGNEKTSMFECSLDPHCWGVGFDEQKYTDRLRDLALVIPLGVVGAALLALRVRGGVVGFLERGQTIVIGGVIAALTVAAGLRFDAGPGAMDAHGIYTSPDTNLRRVLAITGALGLFLALAGLALWRRRRERARIA